MKKNRMMIKRKKRKGSVILVVIFCIILPIVAIYLGLRITELWVSPALNQDEFSIIDKGNDQNPNSEEDKNEDNKNQTKENAVEGTVNKITSEIKPFSIYTIQIASLADNNNLDSFVGELNQQKLPHLIYKMDNSFKVYVVGGTKRIHAEAELERVRVNYPDAYISEVHSILKKVEYLEGEDGEVFEAIIDDFNKLIVTLQEQGEAWHNFYKKEGELDSYIELLKKQQALLSQLSKNINDVVELPETFPRKAVIDKMIVNQEGNINRSLDFIEEDLEENTHRLHSLYLENLFRIKEIIKG